MLMLTKRQINKIKKSISNGKGTEKHSKTQTRKSVKHGGNLFTSLAISLVSKMIGSGLQVDSQPSSKTRNVYVPPPVQTRGEGCYPIFQSPPFFGSWENPIGTGVKKTIQRIMSLT